MDSNPMMSYGSLSPTVNGSCPPGRALSDADHQLLDRLEVLWAPHQERGLALRYETGTLLNEVYGSPEDRQPLGERVMLLAAKRLRIPAAELNRMRWLAYLFRSVNDLKDKYAEVCNWTTFRMQLARIKEEILGPTQAARKPAPSKASTTLRGVTRSLNTLASKLSRIDSDPSEVDKDLLFRAFQAVAEALPKHLGVYVTVKRVNAMKATRP